MSNHTLQHENLCSMKISKLKLQLETYKEVVKRSQNAVIKEQVALEEKMQCVWGQTLEFLEKAYLFHDTKGISSPWWNAQVLRLKSPVANQESSARRLRKLELEKILEEINNIKSHIITNENEIIKLKGIILTETTKILDLKKVENDLNQEPFGFEYTSLKSKVERSKQACLQMKTQLKLTNSGLVDYPHEVQNFKFQHKHPTTKDENHLRLTFGSSGDLSTKLIKETSGYFKIKERTTLTYQSALRNRYNDAENLHPCRDYDNSDGQETEITHS